MSSDSNAATLKNIHSARGEFYLFLSRMFGNSPSGESYRMLSEMSAGLQEFKDNTDNADIINGKDGIVAFLNKRGSLKGDELAEFDFETARHYTTMFCLTTSIPTDESIYTSPEHREKLDSYDKMKALFRKYGVKKTDRLSENEDFISYEFIFMSKLAFDCAEFIDTNNSDDYKKYLKEQYLFHINHLDKWIYEFFSRTVNFGIENENLYKYIAVLASGFIAEDKATLKELSAE